MRHTITPQHHPQQQQQQQQQLQSQQPLHFAPLTQHSLAQQQQLQQQQRLQQQQHALIAQYNNSRGEQHLAGPIGSQQAYQLYNTTHNDPDHTSLVSQQQQQQQQLQEGQFYMSAIQQQTALQNQLGQQALQQQQQQHSKQSASGKQKTASHYGQRYNPIYPSPAPSSTTPDLPNASLSVSHTATVTPLPIPVSESTAPNSSTMNSVRQSLTPQLSPYLNTAGSSSDNLTPSWSSAHPSSSPSSVASLPAYMYTNETKHASVPGTDLAISNPLTANNLYARSLHTPFYQMDVATINGAPLGYGSQLPSDMPLLGTPVTLAAGNALSQSLALSHSGLPVFDVKAYTFRKKPRHYVAVKHKNALRIEPIIYLKTSILDEHRQVVRNWDYLRFNLDRFRDNAQPKKKLSSEGKHFGHHYELCNMKNSEHF
ncbi:hypothetical protein BC939DRAFT_480921 [Gamsiella multidivaricata]|uniref:uncharacterized protein n=1 Tax=Gamsiella multidivaricata TaxID=101098 RepID=UPI002220B44F|nr:uncharacterized protein BC939DRAFT_480921 [Gamsiella multidivaricata]KAI7817698.1 hypothetical protein BC939DRAFT_480921 [Gamsiella multidivaricata]